MSARIIDGNATAAALREKVAGEVARLARDHGLVPGLAVVLVGDDPASSIYVRSKVRRTAEAGVHSSDHRLPAGISQADLLATIARLNADAKVHGILLQLPLPPHLDAAAAIEAIDPGKDVDGLHPETVGRLASGIPTLVPCTPQACVILAKTVHGSLAGLEAVVVGRSNIVGKPLAQLLLAENATVTIAHSKTRDLAAVCRRADLLVAAVGRPELVRGSLDQAGRNRDRRRHQPHCGRRRQDPPGRRRRLRGSRRGRGRDHAGARRRRADDDRLRAGQHRAGGLRARRPAAPGPWILNLMTTVMPALASMRARSPAARTSASCWETGVRASRRPRLTNNTNGAKC